MGFRFQLAGRSFQGQRVDVATLRLKTSTQSGAIEPEIRWWVASVLMCGRFTSTTTADEIADFFGAESVVTEALGPRFNVAPTDQVHVVARRGEGRRVGTMRWGMIPFWASTDREGARFINARAETLLDKPAFAQAVARRRCIVPADGFYEWYGSAPTAATGPSRSARRTPRQPWYVHRRDGDLLAFAGLWSRWHPPDGPEGTPAVVSCTIITTPANARMAPIHDRMPAILAPSAWDAWLDDTAASVDPEFLAAYLAPAPEELLDLVPVRPLVNAVANDGPELIEPIELPDPSPS